MMYLKIYFELIGTNSIKTVVILIEIKVFNNKSFAGATTQHGGSFLCCLSWAVEKLLIGVVSSRQLHETYVIRITSDAKTCKIA